MGWQAGSTTAWAGVMSWSYSDHYNYCYLPVCYLLQLLSTGQRYRPHYTNGTTPYHTITSNINEEGGDYRATRKQSWQ
jgi:hypothetical protein